MLLSPAANLFELLELAGPASPEMEAFRAWRDRIVLPAIFATGGYIMNPAFKDRATVSDLVRMPIPPEAGDMLSSIAQDPSPIRQEANAEWWANDPFTSDEDEPEEAPLQPVRDGAFFRRMRANGDHPDVKALNDYIDDVLLPAIYNPQSDPNAAGCSTVH